MSKTLLFIGVMSGSSLDGIDVALTALSDANSNSADSNPASCKVLAMHFAPYDTSIKEALLALHFSQENELEKSALMANQLARLYAEAINTLLAENNIESRQITAIGCHGQTVRHQPRHQNDIGYTIQLGNHALLAELTHITVIGDFRSRDIAAGGQGAPLVPAFHQAIFASKLKNRAILNVGGIANISYLSQTNDIIGFDTGPGNILLDHWVKLHLGKSYDTNGAWSSTGSVQATLLEKMLADPYFSLTPPKSTGRDLFNASWLAQHITSTKARPQDIARTLVELTAISICQDIKRYCKALDEVYVCGGGAHNQLLLDCLKEKLPGISVHATDELGVDADWVEAAAFAWLAQQSLQNASSNLPAVTGAAGKRVLGAIYPA